KDAGILYGNASRSAQRNRADSYRVLRADGQLDRGTPALARTEVVMRHTRHGATLAILATLACGSAFGGSPAMQDDLAELPAPDYCAHPMVTVGIPREYANTRNGEFRYENRREHKNHVCAVVAFGTPYQLVSWLENGSVQAAVLSDFAISVMRADEPRRFDEEYERFPVRTLLTLPQKERRLLLTNGTGDAVQDPDKRLGDFLSA